MATKKLRKDGEPKRSGLQEGDRRAGRAWSLKLQVINEYRMRQRQKASGQSCASLDKTAKEFSVHQSLVLKWAEKEEELRSVVAQNKHETHFLLHPGSKCQAAALFWASHQSMTSSVCLPASLKPLPEDQLQTCSGRSKTRHLPSASAGTCSLLALAATLVIHSAPRNLGPLAPRRPNLH